MRKKIIIDVANSTIRLPAEFTRKFKRSKQHRKLKAEMIYDEEYNVCNKDSLIITIEPKSE